MKHTLLAALMLMPLAELRAASDHHAFDLGTATSPVKRGWTQVTHESVRTPERGYGWNRPAQGTFNDTEPVAPQFRALHPNYVGPIDDPVLRDGVEDARPLTFLVDVPPGRYWVSVTLGRYRAFRHDMNFRLNGSVVATNIDAWGYVWGSQGGSPTKTVAALAEPVNGQLRLDFDVAAPGGDRWAEYSDKRPEGGRHWFLGENKNSIAAIRVRPNAEPLLRPENDHLAGRLDSARLEEARIDFSSGNVTRALDSLANATPQRLEEWIEKGSMLDGIIGSMLVDDRRQELALLGQAIAAWKQVLDLLPAEEREKSRGYWLAVAQQGLRLMAEGVWHSDEMTNGFSRTVSDVEHGAELMSDTHPLMCLVDYGDPIYLERCMATMRCIIAGLSANIEMSTSEVLFTDRVSLPGNEVLFEMMSGSVGTPTYYPMHTVTWENTRNQVAILVEQTDTRQLEVSLFNFAPATLEVLVRPWRLAAGEYQVTLGPSIAAAVSSAKGRSRKVTLQERGERIGLTVPSRQLLRLRLQQIQALPPPDPNLPDLALDRDAMELVNPPLKVGKPARLRLTLHNIGLSGTKEAAGNLWAGARRIASVRWSALSAPLDLVPRLARVEAEWTPRAAGSHVLRLVADPQGKCPDAVRLNNQHSLKVEVAP